MKVTLVLKKEDIPWTYDHVESINVGSVVEVTWSIDGKTIRRGVPVADVRYYEVEE